MDFSSRIKQLREEGNLTHSQVAAILGKSEGAVRSWEMARSTPDIGTLIKLAEHFECPTDYLLGISDVKNPENQTLVTGLGITEAAIENICECVQDSLDVSRFLSSPRFVELVRTLSTYWMLDDEDFWNNPPEWVRIIFPKETNREMKRQLLERRIELLIGLIWEDNRGSHRATQKDIDYF